MRVFARRHSGAAVRAGVPPRPPRQRTSSVHANGGLILFSFGGGITLTGLLLAPQRPVSGAFAVPRRQASRVMAAASASIPGRRWFVTAWAGTSTWREPMELANAGRFFVDAAVGLVLFVGTHRLAPCALARTRWQPSRALTLEAPAAALVPQRLGAVVAGFMLRHRAAKWCYGGDVDVPEGGRFLPPLETMERQEPSGHVGTVVLPCFPLALPRAALPGAERVLNISEPRYRAMYQDLVEAGRRRIVVPRFRKDASGTRLAEAAVVFELEEIRDAQPGSRFRYVCTHRVARPVRIGRILNPASFAEASTYLLVECEQYDETDVDVETRGSERKLLATLDSVLELHVRAGVALRRWEYAADAWGRTRLVDNAAQPSLSEDSLALADAGREGLWHVAMLWQGYCERRSVALANGTTVPSLAPGAGVTAAQAAELRSAAEAEIAAPLEAAADLAQQLLQANSHGERLAAFQAAVDAELERLAAASALQAAVGGEY
eukprot:CAMPEP_0117611278 /NCGR_PEP_ID=MMETSP0784-20121206/82307_1 /TAXON_ID=39447 /ORGANISM="" /LENGTH=492 /DNA_ID=CAMNT_0005414709 /DNA_START=129 /DNA_END=1609 /DNA_ORIENTATION=-